MKKKIIALIGVAVILVSGLIYIGINPWFFYQFGNHTLEGIGLDITGDGRYYPEYLPDEECSVQLGNYRNVSYGIHNYILTDETVEAYARQQLLTWRRVEYVYDRPAKADDIISGTLDVTLSDGRKYHVEDKYSETVYEDGSIVAMRTQDAIFMTTGQNFSGGILESACIGRSIGERVTVSVKITGNDNSSYDFIYLCRLNDELHQGLLEGMIAEVTVTIRSIAYKVDEEFDKEFFRHMYAISGLTGPDNYEDYLIFMREQLIDSSERNLYYDNEESMINAIIGVCSFSIPASALDAFKNENEVFRSNREYELKRQLVINAVAEAEGIEVSGSEYREVVRRVYYNLTERGKHAYPTIHSIIERYGEDNIKWRLLQKKVLDYLRGTLKTYDAGTLNYVSQYLE